MSSLAQRHRFFLLIVNFPGAVNLLIYSPMAQPCSSKVLSQNLQSKGD